MSTPLTLKDVFDEAFKDIKFDKHLATKVYQYHVAFLNKSREYLEFMSSNLIGVHVVRWTAADTVRWFNDIGVDMTHIASEIKRVTSFDEKQATYKVRMDPLNLAMMYVIHRFMTSTTLPAKDSRRAMFDVALTFFYRCLVLRQSEWFHFPADPKIAQAAYARLSNKFLIKQLKSWHAVMEYRAEALLHDKRLTVLQTFDDDIRITDLISEGYSAIWGLYFNYNKCFYDAVKENDAIASLPATITDMEGVEKLRDKVRHVDSALASLFHIVNDPHTFIRADLLEVILEMNKNTSQRMLLSVLTWLSEGYMDGKRHAKINEFIKLTVTYSYHMVAEMGDAEAGDLATSMVTLKNLYLSTRSTDPTLAKIRRLGSEIVKEAAGKVNSSLSMATRTAVILYITLRTFVAAK